MSRPPLGFVLIVALALSGSAAAAVSGDFEAGVRPLLEGSCMACHGARTSTPLNMEALSFDLADRKVYKTWERIFERVQNGEMPPRKSMLPEEGIVETAMSTLEASLVHANLQARGDQRTPLRRLTRLEYQYTIEDLLKIEPEVAQTIAETLPADADSGGFDTVADKQGISALHVRSYLDAADAALDAAIQLGPRPETMRHTIEYQTSGYVKLIEEGEFLGAGIIKRVGDGVAYFMDGGATYTIHTKSEGWDVPAPGQYRVVMDAYPYQQTSPIVLTLHRGEMSGSAAALNDLLGTWDMTSPEPTDYEVTAFMRPGHLFAPSIAEADAPPGVYPSVFFQPDQNVMDYRGEGIVLRTLTVEGPLHETWPPESTRELFADIGFDAEGRLNLDGDPYEHVQEVVARFAPRAFQRPLREGELEAYASLASPFLDAGRPFAEAVRVPLRAILSAPQFIFDAGDAGKLDNFGLARRLASFLWRSTPDEELLAIAHQELLVLDDRLMEQVERMLDHPKSRRFVNDFAGQAFRLYELLSTTPDKTLYSTYDSRLAQAMELETQLFFEELVQADLSVSNLIDSDFTFVNRRLAEHYDILGVEGTHMRRITLPEGSPRGGLIAQASVQKITANGTTTSPVPRGNFVLDNLLGQPAPPPPAGVEGLEPDTRGATTIREQLDKHRHDAVCNSCHRKIDPPGFALEAFDAIGKLRKNYKILGPEMTAPNGFPYRLVQDGPAVDTSGVTPQGEAFSGPIEYKKLLLQETEQVARNVVTKLLVFGTGAEVEFADRPAVEAILAEVKDEGYGMRAIIREVVSSDLFRSR